MKEKIDQLENLLNEIIQEIEKSLKIEAISVEQYDDLICDLEKDYFMIHSEEKRETFNLIKVDLIEDLIAKKKDRTFFNQEITRVKSILSHSLSNLLDPNNNLIEETRFGSKRRGPNPDFKKILEQNILSSQTRIFANFENILYEGYLSEDGYFNLSLNNKKTKLFSSFATAASFICNKPIVKGWELWFAVDKGGNEHTMEHFKNSITL